MTSSAGSAVLTKLQVPASLRQTWLDVLRDPQYQGREVYTTLYGLSYDSGERVEQFCAIGLAAHANGLDAASPSQVYNWLRDEQGIAPEAIYEVFDGEHMTFTQFADWLEANSEAVE